MTNSFIDDLKGIPGLNDFGAPAHTAEAEDFDLGDEPKVDPRPTFPCESCRGTGRYQGVRLHQPEEICFACKGRGFYYVSYADRMAKRQKAAAKKVANAAAKSESNWTSFASLEPTMAKWMIERAPTFGFAASMVEAVKKWGHLTDGQTAAVERLIDADIVRAEERAKRDAEAAAAATVANATIAEAKAVDAIKASFAKARESGLKNPKLRFQGFEVSEATKGKNVGAFYVTAGGYGSTYFGKIVEGVYMPTWEAKSASGLIEAIAAAMASPVEQARAYGKRTGQCSCCGRPLTDPVSVERGIGPICESRFF